MKDFNQGMVLKKSHKVTQKWPILSLLVNNLNVSRAAHGPKNVQPYMYLQHKFI